MDADRPVVMPEDEVQFRLAQLLLLMNAMDNHKHPGATLERIGYYDFLSANPFLVVEPDSREASLLRLAGFDPQVLSYASSGQRFTSRRERIQHDLSLLVAYGCCTVKNEQGGLVYGITSAGRELTAHLTATYARSFTTAAEVVVGKLRRLSDARLRRETASWLRVDGSSRPAAVLASVLATVDDGRAVLQPREQSYAEEDR
ncbi:ABC-three component system middle component 2 [Streptomyces viridosporus]|uniref:ABC-three component system middle component 2 n=1 Tax=Streptomyces viridosporus TaxID=67581 RepID=UPI00037F6C27|nr:ABC-three component system middle component 2 [Streptomyces viridosporus]